MEKSPSPSTNKEMSLKRKISIELPIVHSKPDDETKVEVLNEKPNKKIIKLPELTSMDPLDYFSRFLDIPEMILQHLSLKNASEVNPSWYNFIACSKLLMKNIAVVLDRDFDFNGEDLVRISDINPCYYNFRASSIDLMKIKINFHDKCADIFGDYNLLKNSSRLYENINILRRAGNIENESGNKREVGDYVTNSELDFFHSKAHEWKNILLTNVYFRKKLDLWKLLSSIESSVEKLHVKDIGALPFEDPSSEIESLEALKFPKLKQLQVSLKDNNSFGDTLARFLTNSVAVEVFYLLNFSYNDDKDILIQMLENFDKLKTLTLISRIIKDLFEDESWKKYQFKLKTLRIGTLKHWVPGSSFRDFLKSQSDHLEKLKIEGSNVDRETFDVIMEMPKLKNLSVWYLAAFSNEVPTKMSSSITELQMTDYPKDVSLKALSLNFLLDSMPKVTSLILQFMDEGILKMLKSMNRKFERLKVHELKGVDRKQVEEILTENYTLLEIVESI